jgi:hypothetical protein
MMKKLLLIGTMFLLMGQAAKAQDTCARTLIIDTLHYYFNKYYFKTGQTTYSNFPFYKSACSTVTNVTHVGSKFENADNTLTVTGVEACAAKPMVAANLKIPIRMYLCNLTSAGLPQFPPIDSISTEVNSSHVGKPGVVGGNFATPHVMAGDFAVLLRNMSQVSGDTVYLLRTAGLTPTFVGTPAGWTSQHKYGEGAHGFVRYLGNMYITKNFTLSPGFGWGTEYEFLIAPRVQYTVQASHKMSQNLIDWRDGDKTDTMCSRSPVFSFTNTSSYQFTNRFFNLNEFYRKWNLYYAFVATPQAGGGFSADSAITWNFEYKELSEPSGDGRVFLKYCQSNCSNTITSQTSLAGCFDNMFRARLRPMSAFGRGAQYACNIPFNICLKYCDDADAIMENMMSKVRMMPNPMDGGVTTITGLQGNNTIRVYDLLGQNVYQKATDSSTEKIDLSQNAAGTYFVSITNANRQTRTVKVIR